MLNNLTLVTGDALTLHQLFITQSYYSLISTEILYTYKDAVLLISFCGNSTRLSVVSGYLITLVIHNLLYQVSAHYVRPNISRNARDRTSAFFKVLSVLSEIFVFIYIGTSISMNTDAWRHLKTWSMLVSAFELPSCLWQLPRPLVIHTFSRSMSIYLFKS